MKKLKSINISFSTIVITPIIIAKILLGQKSAVQAPISFLLKIKFFLRGLFTLIKLKLGTIQKIDVLFVSSNHYEVSENEITYDKFITPFVRYLKSKNKRYRIARYSNNFVIPQNYFGIENMVHLQEAGVIYSKLQRKQKSGSFQGNSNEFFEIVNGLGFSKNVNPFDVSYYQQFILLKKIFKIYLKRSQPKHIVVVCYYDLKSFAMLRAANELGIPTIDLQHGVQGKRHFAYNYWPQNIVKSSKLFPTHFWCWDDWSADIIKSWFPEKQNVITGYNIWMKERVKSEIKNLIVFTAQPLENAIPELIIEAIKNYKGKLRWCIRLHPHQLNELPKYKKQLLENKILDLIDFENATNLPLSELLNKTYVHITDYSSVVLEAMWFGIPSIVISELGTNNFKDQVPENMLISAYNTSEIGAALEKLEKEGLFQNLSSLKEENFEQLANKFFKYNG